MSEISADDDLILYRQKTCPDSTQNLPSESGDFGEPSGFGGIVFEHESGPTDSEEIGRTFLPHAARFEFFTRSAGTSVIPTNPATRVPDRLGLGITLTLARGDCGLLLDPDA